MRIMIPWGLNLQSKEEMAMNKDIKNMLQEMKFNQAEIDNLVSICPMLSELDFELATNNLSAVVSFGYPADDLTYLVSVNPDFLCRNTSDLLIDLNYIATYFPDVETALKNDPNLI